MSASRCVCPGSFDPMTLGHLDVVRRARTMFDEVVVAVLYNPNKSGLFTPQERLDLIEAQIAGMDGVGAVAFESQLVVDVCRHIGANTIVKGLRGETDYSYELPMAVMNRHLGDVETVFLPSDPAYSQVSSSLIKEVVRFGGDISPFVSPEVDRALRAKFAER